MVSRHFNNYPQKLKAPKAKASHQWKLLLEYEGTRYSGWQEQSNARTVSGELRTAIEKVVRSEVVIQGAGRTDAGVHALAQVATVRTHSAVNPENFLSAVNRNLPKDINVLKVESISTNFHPRHDALQRVYLYQVATRRTALAKQFVWWVPERLHLSAMQEAYSLLIGRHDFERFTDQRREDGSTIVLVERVEMDAVEDLILFRIGASHFLWKMVRRIVGVLVEVGRGKFSAAQFASFLSTQPLDPILQDFSIAAHTAPSSGLFLERVIYDADDEMPPLQPVFRVRSHDRSA
jgi:tRNA pseudouridine38-40 synthase